MLLSCVFCSLTQLLITIFFKYLQEKVKDVTRTRIKLKLRKLKYPKRPLSSYIFFIRSQLREKHPDGVFPPVKSPEHIRSMGIWSQRWRAMNDDDRKPFAEQAEDDRKRYFEQLEEWKRNLAQPENEQDLMILERMSRKIENANKSEKEVKEKQRKVAARVIKMRMEKKTAAEKKALAAAKKKKEKTLIAKPVKKATTTTKKAKTLKKSEDDDDDDTSTKEE